MRHSLKRKDMADSNNTLSNALADKLRDINTPGFVATLTPSEADELFFEEPAIPDDGVIDDIADLVDQEE